MAGAQCIFRALPKQSTNYAKFLRSSVSAFSSGHSSASTQEFKNQPILFTNARSISTHPTLQSSGVILAGLGLAAVGFGARFMMRTIPNLSEKLANATAGMSMPSLDPKTLAGSKYYKGGFEPKMSKREAALILGVSPSAPTVKVKQAYMKLMLINHPDKGGSPYISAKLSEAKDKLDS